MQRLKYIYILVFFSSINFLYGQDPQFTQFYSNPMYQSPSFAGAVEGYRVSLNYRDQWPALPGKITTASFALDYNLAGFNSGLGIIVMRDKLGSSNLTNLNVGFLYAYNIRISRKIFFRPGLGFYYFQRSFNPEELISSSMIYGQQNNGSITSPFDDEKLADKTQAADASVSGLLFVHNFWIGLTADHLITPNVSFTEKVSRLPIKINLYGGYRFYKVERLISTKKQSITIVGALRHQGLADQMDMGLYWSYEPIILGVWYRDLPFIKDFSRRDAIALLVGYKYMNLSVGYSYDFTVSRMITNTGGAHEISLIYKFDVEQRKKFKPIPCPMF
ncbi:MAG: PorP/SprF family type IX secretion system membrane protein [Salinivirgaceae bacterium]|nr:PorP/SprF family type IX secretion system membrane protein [Salinivirgaceae bacterium]